MVSAVGEAGNGWVRRGVRVLGSLGGGVATAVLVVLAAAREDSDVYEGARHAVLAGPAAVVAVASVLREGRLTWVSLPEAAARAEGGLQAGARPWVALAVTLYVAGFYAGVVARCAEGRDLEGRVAGELTRQLDCGEDGTGRREREWALGLGAAFLALQGLLYAERRWIDGEFGKDFSSEDEGCPDQSARGAEEEGEGEESSMAISSRAGAWMVGALLGAGCVAWVLHRLLWAPNYIATGPSTCPAAGDTDKLFYGEAEGAHMNDLDCCPWQSRATCCRRRACAAKVDAPAVEGAAGEVHKDGDGQYVDVCNDLLGLLNCAPCRRDSGLFSGGTLTSTPRPWRDATLDVCERFCGELHAACGERALSAWIATGPCAFGSHGCPFVDDGASFAASLNASANASAPASASLDAAHFCEGLGLAIAPTPYCFSLAAPAPQSRVALALSVALTLGLTASQ